MAKLKKAPLIGKDGLHGTLLKSDDEENVRFRRLQLEDGQEFLVASDALEVQKDGSYYLPLSLADLEIAQPTALNSGRTETVISLVAEELDVQKQTVVTGRVRLHKIVREHEETFDEPLLREQVRVEHKPINRVISEPVAVHYEGDTMIIPVLEEVIVIEKRLMLKEELHVTIERTTERQPQTVVLRTEEVTVERLEPDQTVSEAK